MRIYKKSSRVQRAEIRRKAFNSLSVQEQNAQKAENKAAYDATRVYPEIFKNKVE